MKAASRSKTAVIESPKREREDLDGKVVVITGASSGFGRGAALAFCQAGAAVVLGARRGEVLEDVVRECQADGGDAIAVETDVSDEVDVSRLLQAALARHGRIHVWVNNDGAGAIGRFDLVPVEDHVQVIETTLCGTLFGSYFAIRQFRTQRHGTLINVASL